MKKQIIKIIMVLSLLNNNSATSYALRPTASVNSQKSIAAASSADSRVPVYDELKLQRIQGILRLLEYKDVVITEQDFSPDKAGLTLTKYCDRKCLFCYIAVLALRDDQKKDPAFVISKGTLNRFLHIFPGAGRPLAAITVTGDGETFLEFEHLLYIIRNVKCKMLTLKTNGFWGSSDEATKKIFRQISEAADSNPNLRTLQIALSADAYHNNKDETINIIDNYLRCRDKDITETLSPKVYLSVLCSVDPNFEDYRRGLFDALEDKGIYLKGHERGRGKKRVYLLQFMRDEYAVNWILSPSIPIGKAYNQWDDMRRAWIKLYDFLDYIRNEFKVKVPIYMMPSSRDPYLQLNDYIPSGLIPQAARIGCRYNGRIYAGCLDTPLLSLGSIYQTKRDWISNANNNPFLRAIKEFRMKEILEFAGTVRPDLTEKIPFGVLDLEVMAWLLSQDMDLSEKVLKFILAEDIENGRLTEKSKEGLHIKSPSDKNRPNIDMLDFEHTLLSIIGAAA